MTIASIGLLAVTAVGLVVAAVSPQQRVGSSPTQAVAGQPANVSATAPTKNQPGSPKQAQPGGTPEEKAILEGFAAFAKVYGDANGAAPGLPSNGEPVQIKGHGQPHATSQHVVH